MYWFDPYHAVQAIHRNQPLGIDHPSGPISNIIVSREDEASPVTACPSRVSIPNTSYLVLPQRGPKSVSVCRLVPRIQSSQVEFVISTYLNE